MLNETVLRWKARLGQLKALGVLIIIIGGIVLLGLSTDVPAALSGAAGPDAVGVDQLVSGQIGLNRYVSVVGTAQYQSGYQRTLDGQQTEDYYFLVDYTNDNMVLVKSPALLPDNTQSKVVIISGVTHSTSTKLQAAIDADEIDFDQQGFKTNSTLYIGEAEAPPNPVIVLIPSVLIGLLILLSIAALFLSGVVFVPLPIDNSVDAGDYSSNVQASGRFQKLSSVRPSVQFGKGSRKFTRAVTNLISMQERSWLIYIHFIYTYRVNGVPVRKTETDWGIPLTSVNVTDIQPGKMYGWHDRWAVRIHYTDDQGKQQTVFISFKEPGGQVAFVRALGQSGFYVGSGEVALFGS